MPYILEKERGLMDPTITENVPETPGELNYQLTKLCVQYVEQNDGLSYQRINDVIGALEAAKLEFARRVMGPYEDTAIERNGDVYPEEWFI